MVAAAFFDVDRTLLRGSSLLAIARPLRRAGLLPTSAVLRALGRQVAFSGRGYNNAQLEAAARTAAAFITGRDAIRTREVAEASLARHVKPRLYPGGLELIAEHKQRGNLVYLVSSAPAEIVEPLAKLLGADGVMCTEAEVIEGRYTGRLVRFMHGTAKGDAVRELAATRGIDLSQSFAYADAFADLPMLTAVGHPVCVNADTGLMREARRRGWKQIQFVPTPSGFPRPQPPRFRRPSRGLG